MAVVPRVPVTRRLPETPQTADACLAWPPTGIQQARKPAGGFIDCPVDCLTLPWWLYAQGALDLSTLRVWLGTLELVEKRCDIAPGTPVHYGPEELRRLLGLPRLAPVTAALQQLEAAGAAGVVPTGDPVSPPGGGPARGPGPGQLSQAACPARTGPALGAGAPPRAALAGAGGAARADRHGVRGAAAVYAVQGPAVRGRGTGGGDVGRGGLRGGRAHRAAGVHDPGAVWLAGAAGGAAGARAVAWALYRDQSRLATTRGHRDATARAARRCVAGGARWCVLSEDVTPGGGCVSKDVTPGKRRPCLEVMETQRLVALLWRPPFFNPSRRRDLTQNPPDADRLGVCRRRDRRGNSVQPHLPLPADTEVTEEEYAACESPAGRPGDRPSVSDPSGRAGGSAARPSRGRAQPELPLSRPRKDPLSPRRPSATAEPRRAPAPCPPAPQTPQAPRTPLPACARTPTRLPPPTLRDVILADLSDVARLLALHQQAIARGWLQGRRGGPAQRRGCRCACAAGGGGAVSAVCGTAARSALGGDHPGGRGPGPSAAAGASRRPMPTHASASRRARGAPCPTTRALCCEPSRCCARPGGSGELFLGVKLVDPTWTRARWEQAQAALAQWQQRQGQSPLAGERPGGAGGSS